MREGGGRLIAVAVSVTMHAIWFVQSGSTPGAKQLDQPVATTVTRLSFAATEPITPPEPISRSEPVAAPETVAAPQPVMAPTPKLKAIAKKPKPVVAKKPEPIKVAKRISKPEPVKKKTPVKKVKRTTKPEIREMVKASVPVQPAPAAAAPPSVAAPAPAIDEGLIERERQRYLASLMAHIERHKWYPKSARRRRIEGMVHVDFTLFADGSTSDISVKNASPILLAAARDAVIKAVPMPPPPAMIDCPMKCEFRMLFNLQ